MSQIWVRSLNGRVINFFLETVSGIKREERIALGFLGNTRVEIEFKKEETMI